MSRRIDSLGNTIAASLLFVLLLVVYILGRSAGEQYACQAGDERERAGVRVL